MVAPVVDVVASEVFRLAEAVVVTSVPVAADGVPSCVARAATMPSPTGGPVAARWRTLRAAISERVRASMACNEAASTRASRRAVAAWSSAVRSSRRSFLADVMLATRSDSSVLNWSKVLERSPTAAVA